MTGGHHDRNDRDDRTLLADHVAGDPEAFGLLFARHRDRLYAVALRTTGDPELAADAMQEGLIAAFRRAGSFRGDSAVTSWLHRIVVNATLDLHRRNAVRATQPLPDQESERLSYATARSPGRTPVDPLDAVIVDERRRQVLAALRALPAEQRAALVLVDMEGWSVDEAAGVLQCRPGTVKSRCSRGRRRLAQLLADPVAPGSTVGSTVQATGQATRAAGNHGTAPDVQDSDRSSRQPGGEGSP